MSNLCIGCKVVVIKDCEYKGYIGNIEYLQGSATFTTYFNVVFDEKKSNLFKEDEIIRVFDGEKSSELESNFAFINRYLNADEIKKILERTIADKVAEDFYWKLYGHGQQAAAFNKKIQDEIVGKYVESQECKNNFMNLDDIFTEELARFKKGDPSSTEFRNAIQRKLINMMEKYIDDHEEYVAYVLKEQMDSLVKQKK